MFLSTLDDSLRLGHQLAARCLKVRLTLAWWQSFQCNENWATTVRMQVALYSEHVQRTSLANFPSNVSSITLTSVLPCVVPVIPLFVLSRLRLNNVPYTPRNKNTTYRAVRTLRLRRVTYIRVQLARLLARKAAALRSILYYAVLFRTRHRHRSRLLSSSSSGGNGVPQEALPIRRNQTIALFGNSVTPKPQHRTNSLTNRSRGGHHHRFLDVSV